MSQESPEYRTIDEVAEILKVSTRTIRRLVRTGKLPSFKVGHQYRVTQEQINQYLNQDTSDNGQAEAEESSH